MDEVRLIDANALRKAFKNHPLCNDVWLQYSRELIDNAPTVEAKTVADCVIAYGDGYETARRLYEKPHIIDNCDMNVFEPEKKLQTPSCLTNPERQAELLERYKEE